MNSLRKIGTGLRGPPSKNRAAVPGRPGKDWIPRIPSGAA
jgi:hypothetical protein